MESNSYVFRVVPIVAKNNRNVSGWSLEDGYKKEFIETEYPVRVFDAFEKGALELILTSYEQDHDYLCNGFLKGFGICLTVPGVSPELLSFSQIDFSEDTQITIKPKLISTSKGVRNYNPWQRDCFFTFEHPLRFFRTYDWGNCFTECLTNFTKKMCGCARFSMPSMYRLNCKKFD